MALAFGLLDHVCMARTLKKKSRKPGHFLREWRESQTPKPSLERVGEMLDALSKTKYRDAPRTFKKIGTSHGNLSRIERGDIPYSQQHLELLADIYRTDPGSLITRNPNEPAPVYAIWNDIPENDRPRAADILRAFVPKTAPNRS